MLWRMPAIYRKLAFLRNNEAVTNNQNIITKSPRDASLTSKNNSNQ